MCCETVRGVLRAHGVEVAVTIIRNFSLDVLGSIPAPWRVVPWKTRCRLEMLLLPAPVREPTPGKFSAPPMVPGPPVRAPLTANLKGNQPKPAWAGSSASSMATAISASPSSRATRSDDQVHSITDRLEGTSQDPVGRHAAHS